MSKKVLFIEAGRREELISKFYDLGCQCFTLETNTKLPLPKYVEILPCRPWHDKYGIVDVEYHVDLIKPTVVVPCSCKAAYEYNRLYNRDSSYQAAKICYDKQVLENQFRNEIYYPTIDRVNSGVAIQKPRNGNGGKNIERVMYNRNFNIDNYISEHVGESVFQGAVKGKEYSVDCFYQKGKLIEAVPRERLRVVGGEVIESITVENEKIIEVVKDIGTKIWFDGPICMQFIQDNRRVWLIEINHRFGGGSTLGIEAGMNAPLWMIYPETCKDYKFGSYRRGLYLTRNYRDYFYEIGKDSN